MSLRVAAYVKHGNGAYEARIGFFSNPPMILGCTLMPEHKLTVTKENEVIQPDYETKELLEHLVLLGARKIRTESVDIMQKCGGRCVDTDDEFGIIYEQHQIAGEVEAELTHVPRYLEDLIAKS